MAQGIFTLKQVNQAIRQSAWSEFNPPQFVEYLVVAGGGGGRMGGAGAGGLLTGIVPVVAGTTYTVTVGAGGTGSLSNANSGTSGDNSVFGSIAATGGGRGAYNDAPITTAASGGSGGGGGYIVEGAAGTSGQGNAGGFGHTATAYYSGGGGGGAGTVGINGIAGYAGNGGAGIASSISGTLTLRAGGGGGGGDQRGAASGTGGVGGGGDGNFSGTATPGSVNTGGGGGGAGYSGAAFQTGGAGGSGSVIVRYPGTIQFYTGGTVNYSNGYIIHIFRATGTLAPTTPTAFNTTYQISNSLRFRSSASAYLNRSPTVNSVTRNAFTYSAWVKLGAFTDTLVVNDLFQTGTGSTNYMSIGFANGSTADQLALRIDGYTKYYTNAVFRDPAAWYHITFAFNSNAAAASRVKIYVNGSEQTTVVNNEVTAGYNSAFGVTTNPMYIGRAASNAGFTTWYYMEYNLAEVNFVDGQALTPSAFGAYSEYNQWLPIRYAGTYGTNGFYLPFTNTASTSTLVADSSGNANNWTPNNISLTAGSTYDSLTDVPTLTSETVANYAVLNRLQIGGVATSPTPITLSNSNLSWSYNRTSSGSGWIQATIAIPSTGKWYYEYVSDGGSPVAYSEPGIMDIATPKSQSIPSQYRAYYGYDGTKISNGVYSAYGAAAVINDVLSVAIDMDNGALYFGKNGTYLNSGVPTSGASKTGAAFTDLISAGVTWVPMMGVMGNNVATGFVNFGQRPFTYTPPTGYLSLNTYNI